MELSSHKHVLIVMLYCLLQPAVRSQHNSGYKHKVSPVKSCPAAGRASAVCMNSFLIWVARDSQHHHHYWAAAQPSVCGKSLLAAARCAKRPHHLAPLLAVHAASVVGVDVCHVPQLLLQTVGESFYGSDHHQDHRRCKHAS